MENRTLTKENIIPKESTEKRQTWPKEPQHPKQPVRQHWYLITLYNRKQGSNHVQVNHRLLNRVSSDHNQLEANDNKRLKSYLDRKSPFTSHVVIPRDENLDIVSSTVILPTPITSIWSAGLFNVLQKQNHPPCIRQWYRCTNPYNGPSFPIADTSIILFEVKSHTLSINGWSIKSGPPILKLSTCTFLTIA